MLHGKQNTVIFLLILFLGTFANAEKTNTTFPQKVIGGICAVSCSKASSKVGVFDDRGKCVHALTFPCAPYRCDEEQKNCRSACNNNTDCAKGYECYSDVGECGLPSAKILPAIEPSQETSADATKR